MPPRSPKQAAAVSSAPAHHVPIRSTAPSPQALIQRVQADPTQITAAEVLQLQAALGNRAVTQLLKGSAPQISPSTTVAPIQRTIETAAVALVADKNVKGAVAARHIAGAFATTHEIAATDLAAIQVRVHQLRIDKAARTIRESGVKAVPKSFRYAAHNLTAADAVAVAAALATIVAAELTPGQRAALAFVASLPTESSGVKLVRDEGEKIEVHLDNSQLKHQPAGEAYKIGTRTVSGGTTFKTTYATAEWHIGHTLEYMADWAEGLGVLAEGIKSEHGQSDNKDGIHYEGFCMFAGGKKYVLFHCYPHPTGVYDSGVKK